MEPKKTPFASHAHGFGEKLQRVSQSILSTSTSRYRRLPSVPQA